MLSNMRVLFISNFYPPYELGGYEQWCQEVAEGFRRKGHNVRVLTSNYGVQPGHREKDPNVSRILHLQTGVSYYRPLEFFFRHDSRERENIQALRDEIDRFSPDLILIWGMWNLSHQLPYWAEQWMPGRVAYYISNYWPTDTDPHIAYWNLPVNHSILEPLKNIFRSIALRKLHVEEYPPQLEFRHAVCCSHYVRDTLVASGGLPEHAGVLFGGTDTEPFLRNSRLREIEPNQKAESDELRLLYFGRLIQDKGVHTAIQAVGLLKQKDLANDISLTILGSGHPDYEAELRLLVEEMGVRDYVSFVKQIPREEIPKWLGRFDVCLFTSIWPEPMARSVMEAMAAGLLVIGTEVGGQTEMLSNGINSLTFKPEDAETLSNQIITVKNDCSLRNTLAREGQKSVLATFTITRMVNEIEQFLLNIAQFH